MNKKPWWRRKIIWIPLLLLVAFIVSLYFLIRNILGELSVYLPYSKELLGFNETKKYLILFQNNNELRPSGGFISAYGVLDIKNGKYNLNFADSYNLNNTENLHPAPEPFNILIGDDEKFKGWYFRDSNFDVDFKDAVKDIEKLYSEQASKKNISFDGIFAVNFEFLEDLVTIYDISLENEKLTKENLFSILEHQVKNIDTHDVEQLENRKNILGDMSSEIIHEIKFSPLKYRPLFEAIANGLNQKKILLYFNEENLQQIAENNNWAGRFEPQKYNNYIYTNIANIGGRKADRYVKKNNKLTVNFSKNSRASVSYTLSMEHFGNYNLNSDIYKTYVRIFIPEGSEFLSAKGDIYGTANGFNEDGYYEGYFEIEPGEKKEMVLQYLLPKNIDEDNFEMDLIKQPGTNDFWDIALQVDTDTAMISQGFATKDNVSFWSDYLLHDKHFNFEFIEDSTAPLVIWQQFVEPNVIEVKFSESLDDDTLLDTSNYEIKDLNYIDDNTDTIGIEKVYFKNTSVFIKTTGITPAPEERYKLILKNLTDRNGNKTKPENLELTLVQRY